MIEQKGIQAIYPLSSLQQGILFHSVEAPNTGVYVQQAILTLRGQLDVSAFQNAWQQVVNRHPALRTVFVWEHEQRPLQVVIEGMTLPWQHLDWREYSGEQQRHRSVELLAADRKKGFDLSKGLLMRALLIRLADTCYDLIWSFHHLLLDGWSLMLVLDEMLRCYEALMRAVDPALPPVRPYRDYISWLQKQDLSSAQFFWQRLLKNFSGPTSFSGVPDNPSRTNPAFATMERTLSEKLTSGLQSLARCYKLTLNSVVQGAWAMLLGFYTGSLQPVYGVTVSGRPPELSGVETMVGLLINTLPMLVELSPEDKVCDLFRQIQSVQAEMAQFEFSPLVEVQAWANVPRTQRLFDSIYVYEGMNVPPSLQWNGSGINIEAFQAIEQTNYPLTIVVGPGKELLLRATYDCRCHDSALIRRLLAHLQNVLEKICENPGAHVSAIDLLGKEELSQVLFDWNAGRTPYDGPLIHELIQEQAERTPSALAVVCGDQRVTYRELNLRSSLLAWYLRRREIGPESRVAVFMRRAPSLVIALLGVLKAGAAYVPVDPGYPEQRIAFMLQDCGVPLVLVDNDTISRVPVDYERMNIAADLPIEEAPLYSPPEISLDHSAYIIYTSGSTGRPKGVVVTHRGLANYLAMWVRSAYPIINGRGSVVSSSIAFDLTVTGIFGPLLAGREIWLVPEDHEMEGLTVLLRDVGGF